MHLTWAGCGLAPSVLLPPIDTVYRIQRMWRHRAIVNDAYSQIRPGNAPVPSEPLDMDTGLGDA